MSERIRLSRAIHFVGSTAACCCGAVMAQSINVDVGAGAGAFGVPSALYAGASGSPGMWNAFSAGAVGAVPLSDLAGASTAATLSITGGQGDFLFDNSATVGNDQALLDDCGDLNLFGGGLDSATYTFNGLANGSYRVFVYAWAPDNPSFTTSVDIGGGLPCAQICGGVGWIGAHVQGVTYVHEDVQVTGNTLVITVTSSVGWGACNGIQLVASAVVEGSVLASFPVNASPFSAMTVIETNPRSILSAFGHVWISGNGSGPMLHRYSSDGIFEQSYPTTRSETLMAKVSSLGTRQIVISDAQVLPVAKYNWNATTMNVQARTTVLPPAAFGGVDQSSNSGAKETWTLESNGDVWKSSIDANDVLTFLLGWTPPATLDLVDLAYDHRANVLWGFSRTNPCGGATDLVEFVPLDPNTGAILGPGFIGDTSLPGPNLAVSCEIDVWDGAQGTMALIALHDNGANDTVVVYQLASSSGPAPTGYCTAGTSSSGCVPQISATLNPSLVGLYNTTVTVGPMEGQKTGLIFYGVNGALANPWGSGSASFLCVKAPTQRIAPAQNSGGTPGMCNGSLSLDFLQFAYTNPTALGQPFSIGQVLYAQAWYRDPPAPKTTNLSDGLLITLQP